MKKHFGPIAYYTTYTKKENDGFSAWLAGCDNMSFGFEWGWRDMARGQESPIIEFRIGKLWIVYLEFLNPGVECHLLGFWAIL